MKSLSKIAFCFLAFITPTLSFAGSTGYTTEMLPLFADENLTQKIGQLEAGAEIKLVQTTAKSAEIELNLWRKSKGFGLIWYHSFSKNITDAVFEKSFISNNPPLEIVQSKEDPNTGLVWQKVKMNVWVENAEFTQDLANFWTNTENTYKTECSVCHKQRDPKMHDANEWIAVFNGMVGFTDMDEATQKKVLRYLQMNAADGNSHK